MNPPKFHVGQKVASLRSTWYLVDGVDEGNARPQKGMIYHVADIEPSVNVGYCLSLEELNPDDSYHEKEFVAVDELPAEALAELLECLEPVMLVSAHLPKHVGTLSSLLGEIKEKKIAAQQS
jgi:hypothetical protein